MPGLWDSPGELWSTLKPHADSVWLLPWEREVYAWIHAHRHPVLDAVFIPVSLLTEWGMVWIALLAAMFLAGDARRKRVALQTAVALLFASVCVIVPLMYVFPRERPYLAFPEVAALTLPLTTPSFPSGHAKSAALVAVVLGYHWPRHALPLGLFAGTIAYARMYDGMHFPMDVLFGAVLGVTVGLFTLWLTETRARGSNPAGEGTTANVVRVTGTVRSREIEGVERVVHNRAVERREPVGRPVSVRTDPGASVFAP